MGGRTGLRETIALKIRWRRWVRIVELFARERPLRHRVDPRAYGVLHKELISSCRSLAASANEVDAAIYRYIEDIVQPWLSPVVLARADREILLDLLDCCHQAERAFIGRSRSLPLPLVLLLASFVSCIVFVWILDRGITAEAAHVVLNRMRSVSDDVWFAVTWSSDGQRLCFVTAILVILSIVSVSRTARC
jgi:hypothetical protein